MSQSRVCNIHQCKQPSLTHCNCCRQYLCNVHRNEHWNILKAQLTPLVDEISKLSDRLTNISLLEAGFFIEIDKWRNKAHQTIDQFCEQKKREYEECVQRERKERIEVCRLRDQIDQFIREQEATQENIDSIKESLRSLQKYPNQSQSAQFHFSPFTIDDHLVSIYANKLPRRDFSLISPPYRKIKMKNPSSYIAASENSILVAQDSKLCLFNRELVVKKEIRWRHDSLSGNFWSKSLARFVLLTGEGIFTLNDETMTVDEFLLDCNSSQQWWRGTCSNNSLFLTTPGHGPSVYEYSLYPSIEFVQKYGSPVTCAKEEEIFDLSSNNISLALVVVNRQNESRLDLCSLKNLGRYRSFVLGSVSPWCKVRGCALSNDQWLVINENHSQIFHISADGKVSQQRALDSFPWHAVQVNTNIIAILTRDNLNLYQLS